MYADSTFGGHFKEQLESVYDMRVVISKSPIKEQSTDSALVIHQWSRSAGAASSSGWAITVAWPKIMSGRLYQPKRSSGLAISGVP